MQEIIFLIAGIPLAFLYFKFYLLPTFRIYKSFPEIPMFRIFIDEELSYDFKIRHGILYTLMDIWIGVVYIIVTEVFNNIQLLERWNEVQWQLNINEETFGIIIMLIIGCLIFLLIPILLMIYLIKHHSKLKKYEFKNHSRIGVELTHFVIGITSIVSFPIGVGVKLGFKAIDFMMEAITSDDNKSNEKKRYSTYYSKTVDSKGNVTYVDTVIDNKTGLGSIKVEDSNGNKSYSYISKDK